MLDVKSTTKGVLFPRLTSAQISAIVNPANGLQVFCITDSKVYIFVGAVGQWKEVAYGTGIITPPYTCGSFMTIYHDAGTIAPVSKTVTYGTVANIPGEPSKCWITGNLGADHQAISVDDATEASAGWYWQFNRMQGFKHDGTTRTPGTTWIYPISETLDWQSANDPCTHELGSGWRIPTYLEWYNVDNVGGWTLWNDLWTSGLKLHAAGYLSLNTGSMQFRGSKGMYSSSIQNNNTLAYGLGFGDNYSATANYTKSYGFTLRCIKDN